jgi:hypothetical protein
MPDASKPIQKGASKASNIVSLPSLSNSLSSLPQAKSLAHVAVYNSSMSGRHAAESEAKLKKALSNNVGAAQALAYTTSSAVNSTHSQTSQGLMMKSKPVRTKLQA